MQYMSCQPHTHNLLHSHPPSVSDSHYHHTHSSSSSTTTTTTTTTYTSPSQYHTHHSIRKPSEKRALRCTHCDSRRFKTVRDLAVHILAKHGILRFNAPIEDDSQMEKGRRPSKTGELVSVTYDSLLEQERNNNNNNNSDDRMIGSEITMENDDDNSDDNDDIINNIGYKRKKGNEGLSRSWPKSFLQEQQQQRKQRNNSTGMEQMKAPMMNERSCDQRQDEHNWTGRSVYGDTPPNMPMTISTSSLTPKSISTTHDKETAKVFQNHVQKLKKETKKRLVVPPPVDNSAVPDENITLDFALGLSRY